MDSPRRPVLRTDHLCRTVAGRALVDDVSLDVREGEVLAVVGPSGAGKTSLLRLLNRLDEPTHGTVYVDGEDHRALPPTELRRRVGMVMQTPALFPGSVSDNIRFGPRQRHLTIPDAEMETLLRQVGLPGFSARSVDDLSGGEAQRVAFARTLANEPSILLLDEPTSALDDVAKRGLEGLVAEVTRARSLACVMITHDLAQAARVASRVLVLEAGRVLRVGPVQEMLHAQAVG